MPKKYTYEKIKQYIESYNYKLLSKEYKNNRIKLDMVCDKGHKIQMTFGNFKKGHRCRKCSKENNINPRKYTYEEVKQYIESLGYKLISTEYKNNKTKLNLICNKGHEIQMTFDSLKRGCRCKRCSTSNRKINPKDSFAQYHIDNTDKDFINKYWSDKNIINPFSIKPNSPKKIWIKCQEKDYHGDYEIQCSHFTRGQRCSYCAGKKIHPKDSFGQWIIDKYGDDAIEKYWSNKNTIDPFTIAPQSNKKVWLKSQNNTFKECEIVCNNFYYRISPLSYDRKTYEEVKEYIEKEKYILLTPKENFKNISIQKLKVKCPKNHIWYTTFSKFRDGIRCEKCGSLRTGLKNRLTYDFVKSEIEKTGYKLLSKEYTNEKSELLIECDEGHKYKTSWGRFRDGIRCTECSMSIGERQIKDFLKQNNITYERQYSYSNLKSDFGRLLRFDFYLPDYNLLIEYQGEFHDDSINYRRNKKAVERAMKYDQYKREYCNLYNIDLLEIWYWDFENINKILKEKLNL